MTAQQNGQVDAFRCRRDFRVDFVDGRRMTVQGFDICRNRSLHLGRALARAR